MLKLSSLIPATRTLLFFYFFTPYALQTILTTTTLFGLLVFTILAMVIVAKIETGIGAAVINLAMDTSIDLNHLDLLIYSMEPSN